MEWQSTLHGSPDGAQAISKRLPPVTWPANQIYCFREIKHAVLRPRRVEQARFTGARSYRAWQLCERNDLRSKLMPRGVTAVRDMKNAARVTTVRQQDIGLEKIKGHLGEISA